MTEVPRITKKIISEKFNDFFINVGPNLAKAIPKINKTPLYSMKNKIIESMYVEPVTIDEITKLIENLKNTACGWDDLSTKFIKLSLEFIASPLTHICNQSLQEGIYFLNNSKLQMLFLYTNLMILCILIITDLYHCFVYYQKSSKKLCIKDY